MEDLKETDSKVEEVVENKREEEVVIDKNKNSKKKYLKYLIPSIIIFVLLLLASTVFALINFNNEKIITGVTIDNINIKGLTREEALVLIENKIQEELNKEMKIKIDNEEQIFLLSQIELNFDANGAVQEAYNIGRNSNIFVNNFNILKSKLIGINIDLPYEYNEELLSNVIEDLKSKIPNGVKQYSYCIEEDELIITRGEKGFTLNEEKLKEQILNNIKLDTFKEINIELYEIDPEEINIEKIYEEVYAKAQDAYYTTNPFQVYPEVIGIDFNIEEAKEILKEEKEEYIIPLTITKPNKTVKDIGTEAFPDLLATFTTRYDESNVSRSTNLKIAANKLDGVVVMPEEVLSYNKTVGKRTVEAGYKDAAGYEGGKVVQMLGGGICQVSSTLYDAVVYANLGIVERHNHAFLTSYVGAGKDATVVYGSLDFKFKNTRKYPIVIKTSARNGILKIDIYGVKEETEYEVEISTTVLSYLSPSVVYENDFSLAEGVERVTQNGMNGCKSITYKILRQNGAEVSREVLSTDTYNAMNKYVTRGSKNTGAATTDVLAPVETIPVVPSEPIVSDVPIETEEPSEPPSSEPETPGGQDVLNNEDNIENNVEP